MVRPPERARGFAVVAVVLLLLALTGLAHAGLLLGGRERVASALGPELLLLTGVAELGGLPGEARTGAVAWRLNPTGRAARAAAVVEVGGSAELAGGSVTASGWLEPGPEGAAAHPDCGGELARLDEAAPMLLLPLGLALRRA